MSNIQIKYLYLWTSDWYLQGITNPYLIILYSCWRDDNLSPYSQQIISTYIFNFMSLKIIATTAGNNLKGEKMTNHVK